MLALNDPQRNTSKTKTADLTVFFDAIGKSCGVKYLTKIFGKCLNSNTKCILTAYSDPLLYRFITEMINFTGPCYPKKNAAISGHYRNECQKALDSGDYQKAMTFINNAVISAPYRGVDPHHDGGYTLSLALWERGNILLNLKKGKQAEADFRFAVEEGLRISPNELNEKLMQAFLLIEEEEQYASTYNEIRRKLFNAWCVADRTYPALAYGESPTHKNLSNLVRIEQSSSKGKFAVAADDIKPGDVLALEHSASACLEESCYSSHCQHCFKRIEVAYGCKNCSCVAFCSKACSVKASETYHKYECEFLDAFLLSKLSINCLIALRVFTQAESVDKGLEAADYLMRILISHPENFGAGQAFTNSLTSIFLLSCLRKASYFGKNTNEYVLPTSKQLAVASALFGLLKLLPYNTHEIYESVINGNKVQCVPVGIGFYKNVSFFNHSCDPNLVRTFIGKSLTLVALRPLKAGEEISENYGPNFMYSPLANRQAHLLEGYLFKCECVACRENWPLEKDLDYSTSLKCPTIGCKNVFKYPFNETDYLHCSYCKNFVSLKNIVAILKLVESMYSAAYYAYEEDKIEIAWETLTSAINTFHDIAVMPHRLTLEAYNLFRSIVRKLLH